MYNHDKAFTSRTAPKNIRKMEFTEVKTKPRALALTNEVIAESTPKILVMINESLVFWWLYQG